MSRSADRAETRLATRLSFLAAGLSMACWAPLVPFAKARVGVDNGQLGLLLLCLGIGSIFTMPLTGWFSAHLGSRPMILGGGVGLVLLLPAGYAGILAGSPLLGFISHAISLPAPFWLVAVLMTLVPIFAQRATKG